MAEPGDAGLLKELRMSIMEPTSDCQDGVDEILKQGNESSVLPIEMKSKLPKVQIEPPREDRPVNANKAMELRMRVARPVRQAEPNAPTPASETIENSYENATDLLPSIDSEESPLVPDISIGGTQDAVRRVKQHENDDEERVMVVKPPEDGGPRSARRWKPAPRVYEDIQDEFAHQTLLVVKGKIAKDTPDFESFRRTNAREWKRINAVLVKIEEFCELFGIQFAEIDGRKLSEAAHLEIVTHDDVYSCLVNVDEFVNRKLDEKARIIQRNVRIFLYRVYVEERKKRNKAAFRIQSWWRECLRNVKSFERTTSRNEAIVEKAKSLAEEFARDMDSRLESLENSEIVVVNVIASAHDLVRTCSLMYKNITLILIMTDVPAPYVWDDITEYFGHCGISRVNDRIHFIPLKPMLSGDGISHRLQCDMKAISRVKRLLKGRVAFIEPHASWLAEHRLSVDLGLPIFGVVDTTELQSRQKIKNIFTEANVNTLLSTREYRSIPELWDATHTLILDNRSITKFLIRYGFSQNESSVAYFDVTAELLKFSCDVPTEMSRILCVGPKTTVSHFLKMIESVGGMVEAIPSGVPTFPSVALLLSGDKKMKVLGTFERLPHSPFRFAGCIIPASYEDPIELITQAKMVGGILMKYNVMGYVVIDFIAYNDNESSKLIGYDIRVNAYPSMLFSAFLTLGADFNVENGKLMLLKDIGDPWFSPTRYAFVQTSVTHPGMGTMSIKEVRKACHDEGLFFDVLNRTGFRIQFLESPGRGKNITLMSAFTQEKALQLMERAYTSLTRYFGQRAGNDTNSTLACGLQAIRRYQERFLRY